MEQLWLICSLMGTKTESVAIEPMKPIGRLVIYIFVSCVSTSRWGLKA